MVALLNLEQFLKNFITYTQKYKNLYFLLQIKLHFKLILTKNQLFKRLLSSHKHQYGKVTVIFRIIKERLNNHQVTQWRAINRF